MSGSRLSNGGRIDRGRRISFRFDGREYEGFAGDTIASALLAAGVQLVGRSFRLHRPRGVLSSGLEEPNALVHVKLGRYEEPNVRATLFPLRPGLEVFSQNAWPSLRWDIGAFFDILPKLWSAGFYHKTFIWPDWRYYEPVIRAVAGLGRVRTPGALAGTFAQRDCEVDVLVCGGGLAGLTAAQEAVRAGASVTLVHAGHEIEGTASAVQVFRDTMALGVFGEKVVLALQNLGWGPDGPRRCLLRIRAKALVVATGTIEQPMVFEHNDRPGVMLSGSVTEYLERYAVKAGDTAVLVSNNDAAYESLVSWRAAGITVTAVIDSRQAVGRAAETVARSGAQLITAPLELGVLGRTRTRGIRVRLGSGQVRNIPCDLVAMSGGRIPNVHLYSQAQGALTYERGLHAYAPAPTAGGVYAVGSAAGLQERELVLMHAKLTGEAAAARRPAPEVPLPSRADTSVGPTHFAGKAHRQWLDFQHDVTVADVASAVEQGYTQVEHFKRYTTTGMAVDQGKTSLRNALEQLARQSGQSLSDLRPPTHRPPFMPLPLAAAAGPNVGRWYRPERRLPCHAEHVGLRGHFDDVGGWRRPLHYGSSESARECIKAEMRAVRTAVGLFDGSPLGKLEVSGPDALEFLDRLYVNSLRSLAPGRIRYVLMLRDNGVVIDDGTVTCIGPQEFLVTTTSGNAERIYLWMREWAECEWQRLKVLITPVTTAWGTVTLSGPKARSVLTRVATNVDLGKGAFPHMTFREGRVAGMPARIHRVSFTGELTYEINISADQTPTVWRSLQAAGASDDLRPYGIDALNALRTEKGYLHIGADTDTTTTPLDLGWGTAIERKSQDCIGRGALSLPEYQRPDRLQLVGLVPLDPGAALLNGAHLVRSAVRRSEGYITSACLSPTLGQSVALARLEGGRARMGEELLAFDQGSTTRVRVVKPVFYDTEGLRLQS